MEFDGIIQEIGKWIAIILVNVIYWGTHSETLPAIDQLICKMIGHRWFEMDLDEDDCEWIRCGRCDRIEIMWIKNKEPPY